MELKVGMPAPDFTLPLATFGTVALSNMRGKPVVLYFYPKDDTPGCTTEACDFRNSLPAFGDFDAAVIGISKDTVESHAAFAKKHGLNFHLASDANSHTSEDYGVWVKKSMYGQTHMGIERTTFLVDRHGIIRHIWRKVSVPGHVEEVRKMVEALHHGLPLPGDKVPEPVVEQEPEKKEPVVKPVLVAKPEPTVKPATPPKTVQKPAAPKVEAKKPAAKPAPKKPAKAAVKAPVKAPVKAKHTAKPVAKAAAKPVKKPVSKAKVVKAVAKPVKKAVKKPVPAKKAVVKKTATKKPVAKKPIAKKPVAKKLPAKKLPAKKVVAKKPIAKKTVAKKLTAAKPAKKVVKASAKPATKAKAKPKKR